MQHHCDAIITNDHTSERRDGDLLFFDLLGGPTPRRPAGYRVAVPRHELAADRLDAGQGSLAYLDDETRTHVIGAMRRAFDELEAQERRDAETRSIEVRDTDTPEAERPGGRPAAVEVIAYVLAVAGMLAALVVDRGLAYFAAAAVVACGVILWIASRRQRSVERRSVAARKHHDGNRRAGRAQVVALVFAAACLAVAVVAGRGLVDFAAAAVVACEQEAIECPQGAADGRQEGDRHAS